MPSVKFDFRLEFEHPLFFYQYLPEGEDETLSGQFEDLDCSFELRFGDRGDDIDYIGPRPITDEHVASWVNITVSALVGSITIHSITFSCYEMLKNKQFDAETAELSAVVYRALRRLEARLIDYVRNDVGQYWHQFMQRIPENRSSYLVQHRVTLVDPVFLHASRLNPNEPLVVSSMSTRDTSLLATGGTR